MVVSPPPSNSRRAVAGRLVHPIGFGAMNLSFEKPPPRAQALEVLRAARAAGIDLFDTADVYAPDGGDPGHNERLIAEAFSGEVRPLVVTKGGVRRDGARWLHHGHPDYLRAEDLAWIYGDEYAAHLEKREPIAEFLAVIESRIKAFD